MRIYLPTTSTGLLALAADGAITRPVTDGSLTAFALTPGLRQWYGEDTGAGGSSDVSGAPEVSGASEVSGAPDDEDLEYAACAEAARASLRLLVGDVTAARRRVVVAADVADGQVEVRDDLDRGVVRVPAPVAVAAVAAVFVDDADAEATVTRAAQAIDAADLGDPAAQEITDDAEGFELSWYAPTEVEALAAELRPAPAGD